MYRGKTDDGRLSGEVAVELLPVNSEETGSMSRSRLTMRFPASRC